MERIYKCIGPGGAHTNCLSASFHYREELEIDTRMGWGWGWVETRRVKLCNTQLHKDEDSPGEGNFNSAAVATNKNACKYIQAWQWMSASPFTTALPLDWMLPVRIESALSELSTGPLTASRQEWQKDMKRIGRKEVNLRICYDKQANFGLSSLEKLSVIHKTLFATINGQIKPSGFLAQM